MENLCKEVVIACSKILTQHLSGNNENYKNLSEDSWSVDSDLNLGIPNMKRCQVFDHEIQYLHLVTGR
jgi:hypothetical protein